MVPFLNIRPQMQSALICTDSWQGTGTSLCIEKPCNTILRSCENLSGPCSPGAQQAPATGTHAPHPRLRVEMLSFLFRDVSGDVTFFFFNLCLIFLTIIMFCSPTFTLPGLQDCLSLSLTLIGTLPWNGPERN